MTNYNGNDKGFIYVACETSRWDEVISKYLEPVETEGVNFCLGRTNRLRRGDKENVAKAHALLIFLTRELMAGSMLEDIVATAVEHNKPMLIVHLDDVELDSLLTMQTDAQQALFRSRYRTDEELIEEIKKAAIFDNVQVTAEQKKQQKRRNRVPLLAVMAAAVLAAVIILSPSLFVPDGGSASDIGLWGISYRDLAKVREIHICGTEVLDSNVDCEYDRYPDSDERDTSRIRYWWEEEEGYTTPGDIADLSGLEQFTNLRVLELEGQQIEDISPLIRLYGHKDSAFDFFGDFYNDFLKEDAGSQPFDGEEEDQDKELHLSLRCNPISSIDGLEKIDTLYSLDISFTNVSELPEGLDVRELHVTCTPLTEVPDFNGKSEVGFEAVGVDFKDVSKLATAESYDFLDITAYGNSRDMIESLNGKRIKKFNCDGLQINSLEDLSGLDVTESLAIPGSTITSLEGIEHFEGIEELSLNDCIGLEDLSEVLKLKSLKTLRISEDMADHMDYLEDAAYKNRIGVIIE